MQSRLLHITASVVSLMYISMVFYIYGLVGYYQDATGF